MRMAGVTAAVVLLVALVAGAWVHGGDGGDPSKPRSDTVYGDPRLPKASEPPRALVQPVGALSVELSGPPAQVANAKVLGDADLAVIAPVTETITALVCRDGELVRGTWLFALRKGQEPGALVEDITGLYTKVGYQPVPARPDVVALKFTPAEGPITYRAHYVSSRGVVRVEAFGPDGDTAAKAFEELLATQLRTLPAAS
jgi:hypothetical protein